jgi:hypothetical protein
MVTIVTSFGRLHRLDAMGQHTYRMPIVRELPAPPPAAGVTSSTW